MYVGACPLGLAALLGPSVSSKDQEGREPQGRDCEVCCRMTLDRLGPGQSEMHPRLNQLRTTRPCDDPRLRDSLSWLAPARHPTWGYFVNLYLTSGSQPLAPYLMLLLWFERCGM